jgi:hypothetical protein
VLYFLHKNGHILEGRLLVKVVPKNNSPPFFMVIVKPTPPKHELILVEKVEKTVQERTEKTFQVIAVSQNLAKAMNV